MIKDQHIIEILKKTDQKEKLIYLDENRVLSVWNIAWGYDIGDEFAHITTNISPEIKNTEIGFFFTNEIQKIEDKENGKTLFDRQK